MADVPLTSLGVDLVIEGLTEIQAQLSSVMGLVFNLDTGLEGMADVTDTWSDSIDALRSSMIAAAPPMASMLDVTKQLIDEKKSLAEEEQKQIDLLDSFKDASITAGEELQAMLKEVKSLETEFKTLSEALKAFPKGSAEWHQVQTLLADLQVRIESTAGKLESLNSVTTSGLQSNLNQAAGSVQNLGAMGQKAAASIQSGSTQAVQGIQNLGSAGKVAAAQVAAALANLGANVAKLNAPLTLNDQIKDLEKESRVLQGTMKAVMDAMKQPLSTSEWSELDNIATQLDADIADLTSRITALGASGNTQVLKLMNSMRQLQSQMKIQVQGGGALLQAKPAPPPKVAKQPVLNALPVPTMMQQWSVLSKSIQSSMGIMSAAVERFTSVARKGFILAGLGLTGFIAAGLRGTTEGEVLTYRFSLLSREITATFYPTLIAVIDGIGQVVNWFRELNSEGQASIGTWALMAAGAALFTGWLPKVVMGILSIGASIVAVTPVIITSINAVVTAVTAGASVMNVALAGIPIIIGLVVTAIAALAALLGIGAAGFGAIVLQTGAWKDMLSGLMNAIKPLIKSVIDGMQSLMQAIGPVIKSLTTQLSGVVQKMVPIIKDLVKMLVPVVVSIVQLFAEAMSFMMGLLQGFMAMWPAIKAVIEAALVPVIIGFKLLIFTIQILRTVWDAIQPAWKAFFDWVGKSIDLLLISLGGIGLAVLALKKVFGKEVAKYEMPKVKEEDKKKDKGRFQLSPSSAGFESIQETYNRLQMAAMKDTLPPQEQTAKNTGKTVELLEEMKKAKGGNLVPAIAE